MAFLFSVFPFLLYDVIHYMFCQSGIRQHSRHNDNLPNGLRVLD